MKPSFKDILNGMDRGSRAKADAKLPDWAGIDLDFPTSLCLEQCSSSETARHKAAIAAAIFRGPNGGGFSPRIADLTGGLGADSFAFAGIASEVWYNERDGKLAAAVEGNFRKLGVGNVGFHSYDIGVADAGWEESLRAFRPDLIYLDPARRSAEGKKVFLLEDCSPDVVSLWPILLDIAPVVMVKLSPMADITMVRERLSGHVAEVHVVGLNRECKELLCILRREECPMPMISVEELRSDCREPLGFTDKQPLGFTDKQPLGFTDKEENDSRIKLPGGVDDISGFLLDPSPALLKSGARKLLCSRFGLTKMGIDTHLYLSDSGEIEAERGVFADHFRIYKIVSAATFCNTSCREIAAEYPFADVTAKNLRMTSEALRARLGVRSASAGGVHIFGVGVDYADGRSEKLLLICRPVNSSQD